MSPQTNLIVHGRASSSNVQAVMWGAAELGLEVDRRDVGGRFGGNETAAFLAMNPMGKVPVLQDGELTLFESAAILRYLVARYGDGTTLVSGPEGESWAEWAKHTMARSLILDVFWPFYRTPEDARDMDAVIGGLRGFEGLAAMAMTQRGTQRFMMGESLSLADIWAGHVLYRYFTLDLPREVPDGLRAYYDDLCTNPNYARHVMIGLQRVEGEGHLLGRSVGETGASELRKFGPLVRATETLVPVYWFRRLWCTGSRDGVVSGHCPC